MSSSLILAPGVGVGLGGPADTKAMIAKIPNLMFLLFLFYYIYIVGGACTKEIFAKFCKKQLKKLRR